PGVGLREPDRVHAGFVHRASRGEHLVERLHRELHDADPKRGRHYCLAAACTCASSAVRTCCTCWLTIGCRTRWPIEPPGPAILTSALQAIAVLPSAPSASVKEVSMFSIAPTPLPLIASLANSGSRSSTFSMSTFIRRPPRPSGIFTFAVQRRSSWM